MTQTVAPPPMQPAASAAEKGAAPPRRLRVALIGCGAIAKSLHLPVLAGHDDIELVALVDRDLKRAGELAAGYGVPTVVDDAGKLPAGAVDAAIVASPPFHHAPCTLDLLGRGIHVLVEKPMATSFADAEAMVLSAEAKGLVLSVGFFRRLYHSVRMLKALVDSEWLGAPRGFVARNGDMYNWGAATLGNMRKETAGGGVLIDFGSHVLDLLLSVFEGPAEVLEYRDNALGGVEADCSARLRLRHAGRLVEGVVELARLRKLGSTVRVECERGALELELNDRHHVRVIPSGVTLADPVTGQARPYQLEAGWADVREDESWYETFRTQIDDWVRAVRTGEDTPLAGRTGLPATLCIEDCYRAVKPLEEPWVSEGLGTVWRGDGGNGQPRRVLLTGATGFIGARLAEVLTLGKGWQVRGLVHNPANASRLARLPVEMVQSDELSPSEARRLVEGCDTVIHCAIGTDWGDRKQIFSVNVGGTKSLAEAALAAGTRRFVHLSTIALHGDDVQGVMDETTPVRPRKNDPYSESKAEAERELVRLARAGLPAVILRPACVYGPFSRIFVVRPVEAMAQGRFRLLARADGPSNMVYVDNLINAIVRSVEAPQEAVMGEVFTITDEDQLSWREFYDYFSRSLGYPLSTRPGSEKARPAERRAGSWVSPLAWFRGGKQILGSTEFKALGGRVLNTPPFGTFPRWALRTFPGLERWLRRRMKADALPTYRRAEAPSDGEVEMGASEFLVSSAKAKRVLGYGPVVSRQRAMELTLDWVRHARIG